MLRMKFTKHFNGVTVSGHLQEMVETGRAFHDVIGDIDDVVDIDGYYGAGDQESWYEMGLRTYVPCYDLRKCWPRAAFKEYLKIGRDDKAGGKNGPDGVSSTNSNADGGEDDLDDGGDFLDFDDDDDNRVAKETDDLSEDGGEDDLDAGGGDFSDFDDDDDNRVVKETEDLSEDGGEDDEDDADSGYPGDIYCCNILYPEMCYSMMSLNLLIRRRILRFSKSDSAFDPLVVWDRTIALIRSFQSAFASCVGGRLAPASYLKWLAVINDPSVSVETMLTSYVDVVAADFIAKTDARREKSLVRTLSTLVSFSTSKKYEKFRGVTERVAKRQNASVHDIKYDPPDKTYFFEQFDERW
ncbi:MAG: hypothetical protein LBP95_05430 [Deltaproteobacteria bacterium]|jgi:hypothetical protein|nr:hypothetical protein [Deltaproteobacteria bacterium]